MTIPPPSAELPINLPYAFALGAAAACGGLMFGFDIAIIAGAGPFLVDRFALSPLQMGLAFSILLFGCALGALGAGPLSDRFGRRRVMLAVAVIFAVTSVWTGLAPDYDSLLLARFVGGLGVGAVSVAAPTYVSEISPPSIRGRMGALYQLSIVIGIFASYLINYALKDIGPDAWRWMFASGAAPSVAFFLLVLWAAETPAYLVKRGREEEARRVLERLGGERADAALMRIRASVAGAGPGLKVLLEPRLRKPLLITIVLAVLVHASGINTVIDYAPLILRSAGFTLDAALFSTLVLGGANLLFTLVSFWTIDRFGRKPLYLVGSLGMAAALAGMMIAVATGQFQGVLVLSLIVAYLFFFASCIGPVFWTLTPELFPNTARGVAMSVPVLTQWIANAVVVLVFPSAFAEIGRIGTFALLASACVLQAVFVQLFAPETRNRSLEEIEGLWSADEAPARGRDAILQE